MKKYLIYSLALIWCSSLFADEAKSKQNLKSTIDSYVVSLPVPPEFRIKSADKDDVGVKNCIISERREDCVNAQISYSMNIATNKSEVKIGDRDLSTIEAIDEDGKSYPIIFKYGNSVAYSHNSPLKTIGHDLIIEDIPLYGKLRLIGVVVLNVFDYQTDGVEYPVKDYIGKTIDLGVGECHIDVRTEDDECVLILNMPKDHTDIKYNIKNSKDKSQMIGWSIEDDEEDENRILIEHSFPKENLDKAILILTLKINEEYIAVPIDAEIDLGLKNAE